MARVRIAGFAWGRITDKHGSPRAGKTVVLQTVGGEEEVPVYTTRAGSVEAAVTDGYGQIPGWVPEGSYERVCEGTLLEVEAGSGQSRASFNMAPEPSGDPVADLATLRATITDSGDDPLLIPPKVYELAVLADDPIILPAGCNITAHGATFRWVDPDGETVYDAAADFDFFKTASGATCTLNGGTIEGPTSVSDPVGAFHGVRVSGAGAVIRAKEVTWRQCTFSIWNADDGTGTWITDCKFYGKGPIEERSTAILFSGSSGERWCELEGCRFYDFGLTGSNLYHGLYIDDAVDVRVFGCRFYRHRGNGFYAQIHDGVADPKGPIFEECYFGAYTALGPHCINTSNRMQTRVAKCIFAAQNQHLEVDGDGDIEGCVFHGEKDLGANEYAIVGTENGGHVRIRGCAFVGSIETPIRIDWNSMHWSIEGNIFRGDVNGDTLIHLTELDVLDGDHPHRRQRLLHRRHLLHPLGRRRASRGARQPLPLHARLGRDLRAPGLRDAESFTLEDNFFNQGGTVDECISIAGGAATTFRLIRRNRGPKSIKSENSSGASSASVSFTSGVATIAHGLGAPASGCSITPTKWGFAPTGAGGNRQVWLTGVDSTNLTIEYRNADGTLRGTESAGIRWWAES